MNRSSIDLPRTSERGARGHRGSPRELARIPGADIYNVRAFAARRAGAALVRGAGHGVHPQDAPRHAALHLAPREAPGVGRGSSGGINDSIRPGPCDSRTAAMRAIHARSATEPAHVQLRGSEGRPAKALQDALSAARARSGPKDRGPLQVESRRCFRPCSPAWAVAAQLPQSQPLLTTQPARQWLTQAHP